MDHGKRDVSSFPIATGTYYKVNYAPGTDISRYKNIPVPTSYMAYQSKYDFVGTYDHRQQARLVDIASHLISPGKKQWTWGNGDFGRRWGSRLTNDEQNVHWNPCAASTPTINPISLGSCPAKRRVTPRTSCRIKVWG